MASSAVTNVAAFTVQITNSMFFTVSPVTNRFDSAVPGMTNAAGLLIGGPVTNAVTEAGTSTNVPALLLIDTKRLDEVTKKAATKAVKDAAEAVRAAAEKTAEEERKRRVATRTFRLVHADATEVADRFNATWSGDFGMTWKIAKIAQAFPEANTVMVTAPGVILDACEKVVKDVDVAAPQVYIEARFVELSSSAMHKLGIDWSMLESMKGSASLGGGIRQYNVGKGVTEYTRTINHSDGTATYTLSGGTSSDGSLLGGSDGTISYFNGTLDFGQMYLVLSALERENDVRVFSNPKIIVASGKKATVDMTTKYPNVSIAAKKTINNNNESVDLDMKMSAIPGEDSLMFAKEAFFSWGISLDVTPRVGTNGIINVSIVPTISSLTSDSTLGGQFVTAGTSSDDSDSETYSSKYPIIDVQRLVTDFAMRDGMTAVIGGLSKTTEEQIDSGIPWLRDIPWIGDKIFGGKSRQKVQKEILVFVSVGMADSTRLPTDAGLPRNAVLGREYTDGIRREPGDRRHSVAGATALDLRSLEDQAADPRRTNRTENASFPLPFTKRTD